MTDRMITAKESNVSAPSTFSHEQLLDRLGEVAVRVGLNIAPGQQLLITAPLAAVPLVRRVTEHAYKAGASLVTTLYADDETTLARFIHAPDEAFDVAPTWLADGMARAFREGAARMAITGANPTLLKGQDPERISRANRANSKANRPAMEIITQFAVNWNIIACATPAWAAQVFPELPADEALAALWDGIFKASRVDVADPVAEWKAHNARLHARAKYMNDSRFEALHFSGPGTDLTVGLADGHLWAGGSEKSGNGIVCNPNIPTEEIFTTPHRSKVDGRVSSTKPLFHQGTLIDNISVRFENGKIVEASASHGEDVLKRILSTDEGAARIGEVALVPHSSPISASKILYRNTLFDENASSHIALGQAYTKCMVDIEGLTPEELLERGVNDSLIHIDWMIGSDKIDLDGLKNGNRVPLMRAGEWVQA
ncbi:aminopeptidase [Gluconobacter oxydans]|uniref:Aminopeptidase n=2 Tax=Gluconobacter oxydans TaxID=442 RepID=Q5FQA8_GLUOX|nr:aminopeptidase [Gluconobacter oxydans]AAW61438.1 Aminopeptidase [Gluconobacter oxydans 621H]KXV18645.1 peptidase M29 [Gluconobacter oxydans]KXV31618.1 peptidase M29 [Gluconobacter oxydans]MBF0856499.1 aminopeptidase [Gluconobacter oxydans]TCW25939.1 aminopeptidase [Gluconobacter oxydans]